MWLTLAAAGFFALIVLITLLRAEKSVANGALTVITLLAIGICRRGDDSRLRAPMPQARRRGNPAAAVRNGCDTCCVVH